MKKLAIRMRLEKRWGKSGQGHLEIHFRVPTHRESGISKAGLR